MKLDIDYPYTDSFDKAYLVNSQGRNSVCLYNSKTKQRFTTSYARYLMSVHLGRYLNEDEEVDHIDNDKSNDVIENLQILSRQNNIRKQASKVGKKRVRYECPVCENIFDVRKGLSHLVVKTKKSMTCSRTCGGKISHMDTEDRIRFIEEFIDNEFVPLV